MPARMQTVSPDTLSVCVCVCVCVWCARAGSLMDVLTKEELNKPVTAEVAKKMEDIQDLFTPLEQQLEQEKAKGEKMSKESTQLSEFLQAYKQLVAADLIKPKGAPPSVWGTFKDLYLLLRKWQVAIRRQLSRAQGPRQLENLSKTLAESKGSQMEVPGQYLDIKEPMPAQHVKVDRVLPDIEIADLNMACHRKIVIRGNDTKYYHFVVEATNSPYPSIGSSDERILQVCQLMNRCMEKEKQTRRRQMNLHMRGIIGLAPRCRLISVDKDAVPLMQVLEDFLAPKNMTADGVALKFAERVQMLYASSCPHLPPAARVPRLPPALAPAGIPALPYLRDGRAPMQTPGRARARKLHGAAAAAATHMP